MNKALDEVRAAETKDLWGILTLMDTGT